MIIVAERRLRIANEAITVQTGGEGRVQPIDGDQLGQTWHLRRQTTQQPSQRIRLNVQLGDARTLAGHAKKLNMHMT